MYPIEFICHVFSFSHLYLISFLAFFPKFGAGAVLRAIDGSLVYTQTPHLEYIIFCSIRFSDIKVCRFTIYVKVWELQQIMLPNTGQSF